MRNENLKWQGITDLAIILSEQNNFAEVLRIVCQKATDLFEAESAFLMLANPQTGQTLKTIFKEGGEWIEEHYHPVCANVGGWVLHYRQPFLSADLQQDARFAANLFSGIPVRSVLAAPLKIEGAVVGYLLLINQKAGETFEEEDLILLQRYNAVVSPYIRNVQKLQEYFEAPVPEEALLAKYRALGLLGKSRKFIELLQSIEAAARCDVRIYLKGETGTGKELIARAIHQFSHRSRQKFVAIDCGAIPENLIESELFGHTKGAFTGASRERKGLFEEADGGTLFMDEIGNLPMSMQSKLMRVLQEGEIRPIGGNVSRKINVRTIAATSSALNELVQQGEFREDLFYRLHVYPIFIPSLAERREDIALIANFYLKKFAAEQQKKAETFHESILRYMKNRPWPGNVRELENFVERMITMAAPTAAEISGKLIPADLASDFKEFTSTSASPEWEHSLTEKLQSYEEQVIRKALEECNWNRSRAAKLLKISESNMRFRMAKLNITKPD